MNQLSWSKIGVFLALGAKSAGITWRIAGEWSKPLIAFAITLVLAWLSGLGKRV